MSDAEPLAPPTPAPRSGGAAGGDPLLTLAHTRRWQALHGKDGIGTLYQGRYRSVVVDSDDRLWTVLRYIERNALRAGLVERARDWRWSSLTERISGRPLRLAPLSAGSITDASASISATWPSLVDRPETAAEIAASRRWSRFVDDAGTPGAGPPLANR